jgi:hypothetical protein
MTSWKPILYPWTPSTLLAKRIESPKFQTAAWQMALCWATKLGRLTSEAPKPWLVGDGSDVAGWDGRGVELLLMISYHLYRVKNLMILLNMTAGKRIFQPVPWELGSFIHFLSGQVLLPLGFLFDCSSTV